MKFYSLGAYSRESLTSREMWGLWRLDGIGYFSLVTVRQTQRLPG
jgi:hypothetical protein